MPPTDVMLAQQTSEKRKATGDGAGEDVLWAATREGGFECRCVTYIIVREAPYAVVARAEEKRSPSGTQLCG